MTTFSGKVRRAVETVKSAAGVARERALVGLGVARLKAGEARRRVTVAVAKVKEFVGREFPEADRRALAEALGRGAVALREKANLLARVVAAKAAERGKAASRRPARTAAAAKQVILAAAKDAAGDFEPALRKAGPEAATFARFVGRKALAFGGGVPWLAKGVVAVVRSIDFSIDPYAPVKPVSPYEPPAVPFEGRDNDNVRRAA